MSFAVVRIIAAFLIAFLFPTLVRLWRNPELDERWMRLVRGAALTAALLECLALGLAARGLHYLEAQVVVWVAVLAFALFGGGVRSLLLQVVRAIEERRLKLVEPAVWPGFSWQGLTVFILVVLTFIERAWFPLNYWRFGSLQDYERTFSLFQIMTTTASPRDGSLPLLVPLMLMGGLDAASVVRFAGPLFATLGCVAAGLYAFRLSGRHTAGLLALALAAVLPIPFREMLGEPSAAHQLATLFWLVAGILVTRWRLSAAAAAATAILMGGGFPWHALLAAGCVAGAVLVDLAGQKMRGWDSVPARAMLTCGAALALLFELAGPVPDGPYQYESAARSAEQIARNFPRGKWFIVSPTHELTSILGRGWHIEAVEFLKQFTEASVAPPDFRFPWEADIFVFAEKRPLTVVNASGGRYHGGQGLGMIEDQAVLAYGTPLGRADTEFKLARVMAAYSRTHDNVSVYFEDDNLAVYRISPKAASITALNVGDQR